MRIGRLASTGQSLHSLFLYPLRAVSPKTARKVSPMAMPLARRRRANAPTAGSEKVGASELLARPAGLTSTIS